MSKPLRTIGAVASSALLVIWVFGERGRLLRRSSWNGAAGGGVRGLLSPKLLDMYLYGRWTNQYIYTLIHYVNPRVGERGQRWWRDRYHGKVLTPELAEAIVTLDHDIPERDLEQIIPYAMARQLVLTGAPDVAVYECACRHARENPCEPTQVCMLVGRGPVEFVLEHNPQSSRRLTQTEAVELLRAEHERGHVHTAWFKDSINGRFYAICNCCRCCCLGIENMVKYGNPMMASSGYVAHVDIDACDSCGACVEACPFGALSTNGAIAVDWDTCMGCGVCTSQCPVEGAVSLVRDERKGTPLDVRLLT